MPKRHFEVGDNCRRRIYTNDRVRLIQCDKSQTYYVTEVLRDDPVLCYGTVKTAYPDSVSIEVGEFGVLDESWFINGQMSNLRMAEGDIVELLSVINVTDITINGTSADLPLTQTPLLQTIPRLNQVTLS